MRTYRKPRGEGCLTSSLYREQCRRLRRIARNPFQFGIPKPQRVRHLHLSSLEHTNQLQSIHHRLAKIVVVGDYKCLASLLAHLTNAIAPGRQFLSGIQIVVAFMLRNFRIVAEPGVVAPPMQPYVANRRSDFRRRLERTPDHWLIDVAERNLMLTQQREYFRIVPSCVAHFHREWIIRKSLQQRGKTRCRLRIAMKRERELQQHRSQLAGLVQYIEAGTYRAFILRSRARVMREFPPHLRRENKARICGNPLDPLLGMLRVQWLIKRSVDLDSVKKLRQVRGFMKALWPWRGIHISSPIRIRPPRRTDANLCI